MKEIVSKKSDNKYSLIKSKIRDIKERLDYYRYCRMDNKAIRHELEKWYKKKTGKTLDLDHPRTFNEKMQWLKLYDSTPLKTRLADKYLVRDWIKEKIGEQYLIPLLGVWNRFEDIDFDTLPNRFVLKATHGCKMNIIVRDKDKLDKKEAARKFHKWLNTNYAYHLGFELMYKDIKPRIIAEEYLENDGDLYDYKVWCFHGKAKYIMFLSEREHGLKMNFYDIDWNLQPFRYNYPGTEKTIEKPNNLNEMIRLAEICAKDFIHVRVDFYRLNDGSIKFGEMTFSSLSGICRWQPEEQDLILGSLIKLPIEE
ncbi:MAG TPA: glycosyl transferase [Clostridiales bacterium]|nr:glycosyl transferase [Clostridiales bacterium]